METTFTNYCLSYNQHIPLVTAPYLPFNYSSIEASSKQIKIEPETQTRPKISFSIESIIGRQ
ncbi:CLUMA_CG017839, isoform A [Clunio marinus]|uniref:CLUMA_CG017839, isoform A n=1 Tax=Clunio marinus TaxID=568069 RepID=A0A1J1IXA7_9DIPT|nr:CLUMA_CG017839, isoform A [Clunio marinus]